MANQVASPMEFFGAAAYYIFNSTYASRLYFCSHILRYYPPNWENTGIKMKLSNKAIIYKFFDIFPAFGRHPPLKKK